MLSYIPIIALVALTSAVPHGHKHLHLHAPRIVANDLIQVAPLAGRAELPIDALTGKCGGDSGLGCAAGYCCSSWGYCGVTPDYCGAGCQFGNCNGNSTGSNSPDGGSAPVAIVTVTPVAAAQESSTALANKGHDSPVFGGPNGPYVSTVDGASPTQAPTTFVTQISAAPIPTDAPATTEAPSSTYVAPPAETSSTTPSGGSTGGGAGFGDKYIMYTGDGQTSAGWPSESDWMSFDDAWDSNMQDISISCAQFNVDNNSAEESANLKEAISTVASESGIDARFILAIVMQESKGCVRAPTTTYSVRNPGLMQSHNGQGTCNPGTTASPQGVSPCPMSEITQMIRDGTTGTLAVSGGGDGLEQTLAQANSQDVSKYYKAARIYNSGSVTGSDLGLGVATHCYASDVANRLTGWVTAPLACTLDG